MSKGISLSLGGVLTEARRLPALRAVEWRKQAAALLETFPAVRALYDEAAPNLVEGMLAVYVGADGAVEHLIAVVLGGLDLAATDEETVRANVYEEELVEGLSKLLVLNAPFPALAVRAKPTPPAEPESGDDPPTT